MKSLKAQTLALASMLQSAKLINQLANGEAINQAAFDCSLDSLFTLDAGSVEDIYGHGEGLISGLKMLVSYLGGDQATVQKPIIYYVLGMIKLQGKMMKSPDLMAQIEQGLNTIDKQVSAFELSQSARVSKIDGLYRDTISQLKPRIIVQGNQLHLSNSDTTSRVRTLLFAGIRAAVLWRQKGGSRWQLLFARKRILEQAEQLSQQFQ